MINTLSVWKENFLRACSCFRLGWRTPDWDYGYLLQMMHWKLKRIDQALLTGYGSYGVKKRRKLLTAIMLISRQIEGLPEPKYLIELSDSYQLEFKKHSNGYFVLCSNASESTKRRYYQEVQLEKARKKSEWTQLWHIIEHHMQGWWD